MSDDMALVREFAASNSEPAFAELVKRHISLVHSAAMRQVGDAHLAEEIAQAVFIILARKAASLGEKTILSAWLYRTTRYAAADALKAKRRREAREQEAHMESILNEPDANAWAQLAPLLDDAMAQLGETDRAALVLRYFENKTVGEIAGALRMEEAAAQKRVNRALEKLRTIFVKRGVTLSAVAIAGTVSVNAVQAAPATLTITTAAVAKGSAVTASTLTLVKGTLKLMAWTKTKTTVVVGVVVLLVAAPVAVKEIRARRTPDIFPGRLPLKASPSVTIAQWDKVKISSSGEILLNKKQVSLTEFAAECQRLKKVGGSAMVYTGEGDHVVSPAQFEVVRKLIDAKIPMKAVRKESDLN